MSQQSDTNCVKVTITYVLHVIYNALILWKYYSVVVSGEHIWTIICFILFIIIGFVLPCISGRCIEEFPNLNIQMLLFIFSILGPFGCTLHQSHLNAKNNYVISEKDIPQCLTLESSKDPGTYIVLLVILPILIITIMLYPGDKNKVDQVDDNKESCRDCVSDAICNGLAAWDIIDMSELMFGDVGCYVLYSTGWIVFFYIALGVSAILTAFSAFGLEKQKWRRWSGRETTKQNEKRKCSEELICMDITITILNLIFNDILFLVLRLKTMLTQQSFYIESVFVVKEILSICARVALLIALCCDEETQSANGKRKQRLAQSGEKDRLIQNEESNL